MKCSRTTKPNTTSSQWKYTFRSDFIISAFYYITHVDPRMVVQCPIIVVLLDFVKIYIEPSVPRNDPPPTNIRWVSIRTNDYIRLPRSHDFVGELNEHPVH
jgi:hypothetical protein